MVDGQASAATAQALGLSALIGAGAFGLWTTIEWLMAPAQVGEIVGEGITPVKDEATQ